MDLRLLNIKVPDRISRTPKSLVEFKRWKGNSLNDCNLMVTSIVLLIGSELKSWLLFYSLPVLKDVLPLPYYKHYSLLVASIHILASDCISPADLDLSAIWLDEFYKK